MKLMEYVRDIKFQKQFFIIIPLHLHRIIASLDLITIITFKDEQHGVQRLNWCQNYDREKAKLRPTLFPKLSIKIHTKRCKPTFF